MKNLKYAWWFCASAWSTLPAGQSSCCQWKSKELTGLHKSHQEESFINTISGLTDACVVGWGCQPYLMLLLLVPLSCSYQIMFVFVLWCPCWICALCFHLAKKIISPTYCARWCFAVLTSLRLSQETFLSEVKDTCNSTVVDLVCLRIVCLWFLEMCFYLWMKLNHLFLGWSGNYDHYKSSEKSYELYHSASLWQ